MPGLGYALRSAHPNQTLFWIALGVLALALVVPAMLILLAHAVRATRERVRAARPDRPDFAALYQAIERRLDRGAS